MLGIGTYERTDDARDLPLLPHTAEEGPRPRVGAATNAQWALIRWYRYRHLPGVSGLQEHRAAVALAGRVSASA